MSTQPSLASSSARSQHDILAVTRFKHLTEDLLPALARTHHWPIRLDHCFKRICLDAAFGDVWYEHLQRPAERHLAGEALTRAVACAEAIAAEGTSVLQRLNVESLRYRGKATPHPRGRRTQETARV